MSETPVTLNSQVFQLKCTLRALKEVNARFGNFTNAYRKLTEFDFDAYSAIVAAGLGKTIRDVEADVFRTGMPDLVKPCTDFLNLLSNGGRPMDTADEEEAKPGEG
jgi:hypothetical protein